MDLLIKKVRVIDPNSPFNNKQVDIFIKAGKIAEIGKITKKGVKTIESIELCVSPGWLDVNANFCDPGNEHKETLANGILTAAKGGYTGVVLSPSTQPAIDSKSGVEYIVNQTSKSLVDIFPMGHLSAKGSNKDLSEMFDMQQSGAIAFSDGKHAISNTELIKLALLYTKKFNSIIVLYSEDPHLANDGMVNEGKASAGLGLKTRPSIAEEVAVATNITIAEYTEGRLHLSLVSTSKAVDLIKSAKKSKVKISADVAVMNLVLNDSATESFNSNYKVLPPLRDEVDRKALISGLKSGAIDFITTNYEPQNIENKQCEFDQADFGVAIMETAFAILNTHIGKDIELSLLIEKLSIAPRKAFNIEAPKIKVGEKANITLFDPSVKWEVKEKSLQALSKNNPFIGKTLKGKVIGVYNNGKLL
ncbi:MAG: dihydroorotase [Bacteroidetes bacterium]|nr:dihydroorotase [Bacteroidota bacterium]